MSNSPVTVEQHGPELLHHFVDAEQQRDAATLGMWLFLGTEIMFFGGMFASYLIYRLSYYNAWVAGSQTMEIQLGAANTAVLICSSLTMVTADAATAVRLLDSDAGASGSGTCGAARVACCASDAWRGMWVVLVSAMVGNGPVGARRMIRVRDSGSGSVDLGGSAVGAGSSGAVIGSTGVVADVQSSRSQPRHGINAVGAAQ